MLKMPSKQIFSPPQCWFTPTPSDPSRFKPTPPTLPLAWSYPSPTTMAPSIRSPSTPGSLQPRKSIIRFTTRILQLSSQFFAEWKPYFECWMTTRISSILPPVVRWIGGRLPGHLSSPTTNWKSCFDPTFNMGKRIPSHGDHVLHYA